MKAVHMEQKYQEADNIITFNHSMNFTMGKEEVRARGVFATAYESCNLDWELSLRKQFGGRNKADWVISLHGSGTRDLYPSVSHLHFTFKTLDTEGNPTNTLNYSIDGSIFTTQPRPRRRLQDQKTYETDWDSKLGRELSVLITEAKKQETVIQLETRMEFLKTEMVDGKWLVEEGAPVVGDMSEYFYNALINKSRHDLRLKTSDGRQFLTTNKEILCLASSYFRQKLKDNTTEHVVSRANSLESIDIALTFLVTGRYKRPSVLSPGIAKEVYILAVQWKAFDSKQLKNCIERQCYDELCNNHEDFQFVCNLLVMAEDTNLPSLQNCCVATLSYYHFHDFIRAFVNGNHPLKERFSTRREFFKPSLIMQVKRGFVAAKETRSFIKYIPVLGQD